MAINLGEDICAETIPANGIIMGLDSSAAPLEDVWMADVAEVAEILLAEEAGEDLNEWPYFPTRTLMSAGAFPHPHDEPLTTILELFASDLQLPSFSFLSYTKRSI